MKAVIWKGKMFTMNNISFGDLTDQTFSEDFFNQTATLNFSPLENEANNSIFNNERITSPVNKTGSLDTSETDFVKLEINFLSIETFLSILGIALQSLIIYFEKFGSDSQKRGLINRVSVNW